MRRLTVSCLLALMACVTQQGRAATLLVTSPQLGLCVTSEDATYDYRWGILRPESGLFSYSPLGESALAPKIEAPREAAPGELIRIDVSVSEEADSVAAEIRSPQQHVLSRGIGFHPSLSAHGVWVVLIGVTDQTAQGSYVLALTIKARTRSAVQLSSLKINDRSFRVERIAMNHTMEALHTSEDPRKVEEAHELIHILLTPHPDAVFETGRMENPFPGARRTSGYGDRRKYVFPDGSSDYTVHEGVDLAVPEGSPVAASGRGRVVLAGQRIITGNTVVIENLPGLFSLYFHLSEIDVRVGDVVAHGQLIGKVGHTGFVTGPHLHWEIEALGVPVDPDALTTGPILDKTPESDEIDGGKDAKGGE